MKRNLLMLSIIVAMFFMSCDINVYKPIEVNRNYNLKLSRMIPFAFTDTLYDGVRFTGDTLIVSEDTIKNELIVKLVFSTGNPAEVKDTVKINNGNLLTIQNTELLAQNPKTITGIGVSRKVFEKTFYFDIITKGSGNGKYVTVENQYYFPNPLTNIENITNSTTKINL